MAFTNQMTALLNKIERRIGTRLLNLPTEDPDLSKNYWPTIISEDTLPTFSRYFPYKFPYIVNNNTPRKDDYYLIDESVAPGIKILGVKDVDWASVSNDSVIQQASYGYFTGAAMSNFSLGDVALAQVQADTMSLFNMGYFIDFFPPNRFCLRNSMNVNVGTTLNNFNVDLLIQHNSILTIEPTKMELFENLAIADVATYLYGELKYFDGDALETVFARTDMKLSDIQEKANTREQIISEMKESYVSAANGNQPMILCM